MRPLIRQRIILVCIPLLCLIAGVSIGWRLSYNVINQQIAVMQEQNDAIENLSNADSQLKAADTKLQSAAKDCETNLKQYRNSL